MTFTINYFIDIQKQNYSELIFRIPLIMLNLYVSICPHRSLKAAIVSLPSYIVSNYTGINVKIFLFKCREKSHYAFSILRELNNLKVLNKLKVWMHECMSYYICGVLWIFL